MCAISVSGQWPYFRHPAFAPSIWSRDQHIDFIPCLETMGEYEAAATWSTEGLKERQEHPFMPLSMLACPAEGHFATGAIVIQRITGPFQKINDTTFRIRFVKGMSDRSDTYQCWFAAVHSGDAAYKPAVQQAKMEIPVKNVEGKEQTIFFPAIPDVKKGVQTISLQAVSDAQVPVYYFVREGPAEINGNKLSFTQIPPNSKFPVKVTVVAWQYGSAVSPKIKTALSVERSFCILK